MPGSTTTSDADAFSALPDADFAREFGVPITSEPAGEEGAGEGAAEVEGEEVGTEAAEGQESAEDGAGEATDEGDEGEATPEREEAEKVSEAEKKLLAEFRAFDDEGDFDAESLAKLKIEYKAKGKTFAEPLDKIIRLAQMGRANQDKLDQAVEVTERAERAAAEAQTWREKYEAQRQFNIEMLEDEDKYVDHATEYKRRMTPEAQLRLRNEELANIKASAAEEKRAAQAQQFTQTEVTPRWEALKEKYPEVSEEEIFGMFALVTAPWLGPNGSVKPEKWGDLVEALEGGRIEKRIQELHTARVAKVEKVTSPLKRQATKAAQESTKAKRTLARATAAPGGGPPAAGSGRSKQQLDNTVTADQAASRVIDDILKGRTWS